MNADFVQCRFFEKKWFAFTDEGLHIRYKRIIKKDDFYIKYEDIGTKIIRSGKGIRGWLVAAIICILLFLTVLVGRLNYQNVDDGAELFYLISACICGIAYYLTYKNLYYITNDNNNNVISFIYNNPTKGRLDKFIDELMQKRKLFLIERYGKLNKNLSYEYQYKNLAWLLKNKALSQQEFDDKMLLLEATLPIVKEVKGFSVKN